MTMYTQAESTLSVTFAHPFSAYPEHKLAVSSETSSAELGNMKLVLCIALHRSLLVFDAAWMIECLIDSTETLLEPGPCVQLQR